MFLGVGFVQTGINSKYDKKKECPSSQTDGKYQAKCLVLLHTFWQWIEGLSLSYLCQRGVLLIVDTLDHQKNISMANCSCPFRQWCGQRL